MHATEAAIRILIVDDHQMFAESLARLLNDEADLDVVGMVTDPALLMATLIDTAPNVVLMDFQLPGADGTDLAADVKRVAPDVMVVMLTGFNDDRTLIKAIEAGCSGFVTKDRAAAEVAQAVRAAMAGEAVISPELLSRLLPRLRRADRIVGADLTDREREVLVLLASGAPNREIASTLFLSLNTVRNYVQSILVKLGAHSKLEAVATAVREGVLDYPTT